MNRISIVLFGALIISAISCTLKKEAKTNNPIEETTDWEIHLSDNYLIKYPSDWEVNLSGQMGTGFILFSPLSNESDNFRENVNLLIQDLAEHDLSLDQYVDISEDQIKTIVVEGKVISSDRKEKNGREYQKMIYTGKQGVFNLKFEQYYWIIDNQAFVLTLTCEEEKFEKYKDIGEVILNSFNIK